MNLSDAVNDIAWSPHDATVFASVTGDGRIELWDLQTNSLSPCTSYQTPPRESDKPVLVNPLPVVIEKDPRVEGSVNGSITDKKKNNNSDDEDVEPPIQTTTTSTNMQNVKMSAVLFAPIAPILIAGDDNGSVKVFRIHGLEKVELTTEEQIQNLYNAMNPDEEKAGGGGAAKNPLK